MHFAEGAIDFDALRTIDPDFYISAYHLSDRKMEVWGKDMVTAQTLRAALSSPSIYSPCSVGGVECIEGAVLRPLNFDLLLSDDEDPFGRHSDIDSVIVLDIPRSEKLIQSPRNLYDARVRSIMVPLGQAARNELELFQLKNANTRNGNPPRKILVPDLTASISDDYWPKVIDWSSSNMHFLFDVGYAAVVQLCNDMARSRICPRDREEASICVIRLNKALGPSCIARTSETCALAPGRVISGLVPVNVWRCSLTLAIVEYPANPSSKQQERWRHEFENQCGMTCPRDLGENFTSWSKTWNAGQVGVLDARVRDQTWASLLQGRCPVGEDYVFVKVIASGSVIISQHGEERSFPVGSVLTIDGAWPFQERFLGSTRLIALRIPKQALKARGYAYGSRRIIVPELSSPDVTFLRDLLICVAGQMELPSLQFRERVGEQTLDMMETLLSGPTGYLVSGRSDIIILRAKTMIARRLGDSRLNIEQIATELRISANYLAKLFRREGTTVMRYVLEQRLDRARSLVKQFGQHRMQIQEIAYICGFESPSHFSRMFKQHFGVSPRDAAGA